MNRWFKEMTLISMIESDDEAEPYYYSYNLQSLNISMTTREHCDRVYRRMTGKLDKSRVRPTEL